jgi:hypothetical protein
LKFLHIAANAFRNFKFRIRTSKSGCRDMMQTSELVQRIALVF